MLCVCQTSINPLLTYLLISNPGIQGLQTLVTQRKNTCVVTSMLKIIFQPKQQQVRPRQLRGLQEQQALRLRQL